MQYLQNLSKIGLALMGAFLLLGAYFILTQGLFGESFVALLLGMPWILLLSYFEFFEPSSTLVLGVLLLLPLLLNAVILYGVGMLLERVLPKYPWFQKT
ncbi:hypothetical protein C4556_00525 [Candidatus Parcubacteria bacterium]|nr:MAG: hypothetical protein C4556_00525 [Candidatus Parcubacteria bacterium]